MNGNSATKRHNVTSFSPEMVAVSVFVRLVIELLTFTRSAALHSSIILRVPIPFHHRVFFNTMMHHWMATRTCLVKVHT